MNDKANKAISYFSEGKNCAQSVLLVFSEDLDVDPTILESLSLGFGGGMGHLQKTCGAVTGAFMVISLLAAQLSDDKDVCADISQKMIRDFHQEFISSHGSSDCIDLLACNLNTEEGQSFRREHGLSESVCNECIIDSIRLVERLKNKYERNY